MTPRTTTRPEQDQSVEHKMQQLREVYRCVAETERVKRVGKAVEEFLDRIG